MFYSKALLKEKGALGKVWVAAVCGVAALSRDEVVCSDIVAFVDKILSDVQSPHRILALLLLGVVRIYSKKVEYLCNECNEITRSFQPRCCDEPSISTGVNKDVHARRLMRGQQDKRKVKKSVRTVRTAEMPDPVSSEGLSIRVETEVIVRTSVVIKGARVRDNLPTFTVPKRFELDSFDLEIDEDIDEGEDHHQLAGQDILLEDEHHHASYFSESYQRASCSYALDSACFMPEYISLPPEVMRATSEIYNILDPSTGGEPERENQNADSVWFTPVKDVLPPEMMDIVAEVSDPSNERKTGDKSIRELNMDENGGSVTSIPLPESQEGQNSEDVLENMTCRNPSANCPITEASKNDPLIRNSDTEPQVGGFLEHDTDEDEVLEPPVLSCKTRADNELSPSTPEPLPEGAPGPSSSARFKVTTPAKIERCQANRKRRRALHSKDDCIPTDRENKRRIRRRLMWPVYDDEAVVLSNEMLRESINNASDLILERRRKAPHSCLAIWKVAKIGSLSDTFMEPLIPIPYHTSVHLACITAPQAPEISCEQSVKARRRLSYEFSESIHSCKDTGNTEQESIPDESRKEKLDECRDCEPPSICYSENRHVQDDFCECNDDASKEKGTQVTGAEPSSKVPLKKGLHESENQVSSQNEGLNAALLANIDEDVPMDGEENARDKGLLHSTRTREIAKCLHKLFQDQKSKQGTDSLSLSQVLVGTRRKTSATVFYETLILKSRDLIDVNQEQPYDDIILSAKPKLEAELQRAVD